MAAGAAGSTGTAGCSGANGFLYSRSTLTTWIAVGWYSPAGALAAVAVADTDPRFPRARPEPRLVPNVSWGAAAFSGSVLCTGAGGALTVSAEATDGSPDVG